MNYKIKISLSDYGKKTIECVSHPDLANHAVSRLLTGTTGEAENGVMQIEPAESFTLGDYRIDNLVLPAYNWDDPATWKTTFCERARIVREWVDAQKAKAASKIIIMNVPD